VWVSPTTTSIKIVIATHVGRVYSSTDNDTTKQIFASLSIDVLEFRLANIVTYASHGHLRVRRSFCDNSILMVLA
jgi:hypothetical protein